MRARFYWRCSEICFCYFFKIIFLNLMDLISVFNISDVSEGGREAQRSLSDDVMSRRL